MSKTMFFTQRHIEGIERIIIWLKNVQVYTPNTRFEVIDYKTKKVVVNNTTTDIIGYLINVKLKRSYTGEDAMVLNCLRKLYIVNKGNYRSANLIREIEYVDNSKIYNKS